MITNWNPDWRQKYYQPQICRWQWSNGRQWRELKEPLGESERRVGLKLNIQRTKIMASDYITSWETDGENVEAVTEFTYLGSKITLDCDCSHEIERCLLPEKKVMTNIDSVLESRDITLLTKVWIVQTVVLGFPGGSDSKASACNAGDPGSIPGSGRSPGEGNGNPLQYPGKSHGRRSGGRLQSMGSQRVRHDWATTLSGFSRSHVGVWELDHKEDEHQRTDAFKLWCWKRLFESV